MTQDSNFVPSIPIMQIRPGCLLFYDQSFWSYTGYGRTQKEIQQAAKATEKYSGKLNPKSRSKLRFSINLLVEQAKWKQVENPTTKRLYKFKVNFITLTLSGKQGQVSDKEIKSKMLFPWIRNMRDVYGLRSYVWRAERQKNGNIHFHITTDTYIPYDYIRDAWNYQQSKFHFIDEFRNRNQSEFPNSTDVHSVQNIRNLASYLVKYMLKDEKGLDSIQGKVWDCSKNLKISERVWFEMSIADFEVYNNLLVAFKDRVRSGDYCTIIPMNLREMRTSLPFTYTKLYNKWLQKVYDLATPPRAKRLQS